MSLVVARFHISGGVGAVKNGKDAEAADGSFTTHFADGAVCAEREIAAATSLRRRLGCGVVEKNTAPMKRGIPAANRVACACGY